MFRGKAAGRGATVLAAPVSASILYAAAGSAPTVQNGTVGLGAVIVTSLLAALAGWGLLALLERKTRRGFGLWLGIALTVYLLSLVAAGTSAVGGHSVGVLLGLHSMVFAVVATGFARSRRAERQCVPA